MCMHYSMSSLEVFKQGHLDSYIIQKQFGDVCRVVGPERASFRPHAGAGLASALRDLASATQEKSPALIVLHPVNKTAEHAE
jgi:hypothetical protein